MLIPAYITRTAKIFSRITGRKRRLSHAPASPPREEGITTAKRSVTVVIYPASYVVSDKTDTGSITAMAETRQSLWSYKVPLKTKAKRKVKIIPPPVPRSPFTIPAQKAPVEQSSKSKRQRARSFDSIGGVLSAQKFQLKDRNFQSHLKNPAYSVKIYNEVGYSNTESLKFIINTKQTVYPWMDG